MKYLFNFILRLLVKIALKGYFKSIIVEGKENIPKNVPVILVANHQNALIDPLLLATHTRLNPYFLTRASVFKKSFVAKMLNFIRMLPVYRVRDGFSTIHQNQGTFDLTYEVLRKNGTVIIFAEGSHSLIRNLRPLSKGFTRIAFGLKEKYPDTKPVILPVALDFSAHKHSGSRARLTFGKIIPVDMPASKSGLLTKSVEKAVKELVVEIPQETYEQDLERLIANHVDLTSSADVKLFLETGEVSNPVSEPAGFWNKVMKIFHFPLYWLWLGKKPSVKDPVFSSTWKFLIGFALGPIYYLVLILLGLYTPLGSWAFAFLLLAWVSLLFNKNPQE
ncbi:1-acyl-sn-glycerol-3-phosphate acyltransferase [Algoriphagus halophytocola]|uniref:1-acyl-sn-glycerol-3-phosphate acyltransferase n=1 Tax=Algoriphagus halophytocola TaxID=2991499 RepID=A0ABY6ML65_9BACT|nr:MULTISPECIES: 1-acyl-sn-glycerol-3-phosphate acyltransferase [unclassified Algoriphagus]UZD23416.1 1-acyl-sn-glycerol-3-phosphate acyltransferase [Algoriphagus sp. TR-M5]WBL44711.1 1-acyl-sn-glycerol-3-phosphate acyltransferase [Algoriphagus sp. TR-M9]